MNTTVIKAIFYVSAVYDGFFGVMGLISPNLAFRIFEVTPPNHPGYVQFPAILLLIFGWMFFQLARDPVGKRDLLPFGIALKVGYSGLVFYYLLTTGIPAMWVPWAWIDLGFLVVFVMLWRQLSGSTQQAA